VIDPAPEVADDEPFGRRVAAFDASVDQLLDRVRGNFVADRIFYTASALGDWSVLWHLIGVAEVALHPDRRRQAVRLSAALGIESLLVNQGVKRLFKRQRPAYDGDHPHELRTPSTSSFPSGHASAAAVAAVLLSDGDPALTALWWSLAAVVALSRPYSRHHHASDTVGGVLVGLVIGHLARALWPI
jgi:undecaprenyl-diphosphatase